MNYKNYFTSILCIAGLAASACSSDEDDGLWSQNYDIRGYWVDYSDDLALEIMSDIEYSEMKGLEGSCVPTDNVFQLWHLSKNGAEKYVAWTSQITSYFAFSNPEYTWRDKVYISSYDDNNLFLDGVDFYHFTRISQSEFESLINQTGGSGNGGGNGGNNGGNGNGGGSSDKTSETLSVLLEHRAWSWYKGGYDTGFFTFYDKNKTAFGKSGTSAVGSYGVPTLNAKGSFSLSGRMIIANYNDISIDPDVEAAFKQFPGWTNGGSKTVYYTIKSISDSGLTLSDGTTTWYLEPFF
ncbi:MAG: hypothetical protein NC102_08515 [Clostridium sp.]|nr:hypothetical protein [Clostridium sp.]